MTLDDKGKFFELNFFASDNAFDTIRSVCWGFNKAVPGHAGESAARDPVEEPFINISRVSLRNTPADHF